MRKAYLESILKNYAFPEEAAETFRKAYAVIAANETADKLMETHLKRYENGEDMVITPVLADLKACAEAAGISEFTVDFVFYLLATEQLHKLYRQRQYPEDLFDGCIGDLLCKLIECKKLKDVWGTCTGPWHWGFFALRIFPLGRLQFETGAWPDRYGAYEGVRTMKPETPMVYTHIPSSGPLHVEDCIASFKRVYAMFPERRIDGILPIVCHSWLLDPAFREILPEQSHIRQFNELYTIVFSDPSPTFNNAWRVFYRDAEKPVNEWAEDTSLKRTIKQYLLAGNVMQTGFGIIFFDGENIIR